MEYTRRSVLSAGAGSVAAGALAGCLGEPGDGDDGDGGDELEGYAAFFALWDWCEEITGDLATFENPITTGEMGHGWEPDGDFTREVAATDAFVYLDTPEFSWAQDVASELEREGDDVAVIDGMAAVSDYFLSIDRELPREPADDYELDPETFEASEFDLVDGRTGELTAYWHVDHWHEELPDVPVGETVPIEAVVADGDGEAVPLGEELTLHARLADGAPDGHVAIESTGDAVELTGEAPGRTLLVFELRHDDEVLWDTSEDGITVDVVEEPEGEGADEFVDPHVWADPVLAGRIVDHLAAELGEIDPENADVYEENAAAYRERLEAVDRAFEELVESADREVAVFAGHDSYQYVEQRYGFELRTPVGVSPDAAESFEDVADLVDVIEAHDIETILYDPFESPDPDEQLPRMVELLIENSSATDHAPLSPAEGTTEEWEANGWGWVEQMEEVNIPSLKRALDAE